MSAIPARDHNTLQWGPSISTSEMDCTPQRERIQRAERPLEQYSTSENAPHTPQRRRYPADFGSRPLLHRRGTSHMYETLEDLLKEAGYKETRVFTPETGAAGKDQNAGADANTRTGVSGAVVKLFSTWMSGSKGEESGDKSEQKDVDDEHVSGPTPDLSPLAHRTRSHTATHPYGPRVPDVPHSTLAPSRAHLALRHAASAPHIHPSLARARPQPPSPTWLTSLSAAFLPPRPPAPPSPLSAHKHKHPRAPRRHPCTPLTLTQRPPSSVALTITNVMCHPAPARSASSYSSSSSSSTRMRPTSSRSNLRTKPRPKQRPPPLPTLICQNTHPSHAHLHPHSHPHPNSDASNGYPFSDDPYPDDASDASDSDGEVDLSTLLIPSKRQHSIRSLRIVLQRDRRVLMNRERRSSDRKRFVSDGQTTLVQGRDRGKSLLSYPHNTVEAGTYNANSLPGRARREEREVLREYDTDVEGARGGAAESEAERAWGSGAYGPTHVKRRRALPSVWGW